MRNFLQHQEHAFTKTAKLGLLLAAAVSGTVLLTGLAVTYVIALFVTLVGGHGSTLQFAELFLIAIVLTTAMVGGFSCWKIRQLRAGGRVIAEGLGGRRLDETVKNKDERRVLNVVHEMAVASGIPAPSVYVLEQPSINAFAAGFEFQDAVIGVTRGCIRRLNRDQLQGVMAHEFSHILNGDMRMNLRLVGVLHGILSVTIVAEHLLAAAAEIHESLHDIENAVGQYIVAAALVILAAFLWPIGMIGTMIGTVVMCATSRTREFLADAYAVQFTRHPEGIAGALKVIAGHDAGSRVRSKNSLEASHFFFARGSGYSMSGLLASHPPIEERISRLDPDWDGVPLFEAEDELDEYHGPYGNAFSLVDATSTSAVAGVAALATVESTEDSYTPNEVEDHRLFTPNDWTQRYTAQLLSELPEAWIDLVQDPDGAQAMLTALWLSLADDLASARTFVLPSIADAVEQLEPHVERFDAAHQAILFDLTLEALSASPPNDLAALRGSLDRIGDRIGDEDLGHWSWSRQLQQRFDRRSNPSPKYGRLSDVQSACEVLISWFCHVGADSDAMAAYAFQRAIVHADLRSPEIRDRTELKVAHLDAALDLLSETSARCRRQLMIAVGSCVAADLVVGLDEANLVRGTFAALGLGVPQLLPGQEVAPGM